MVYNRIYTVMHKLVQDCRKWVNNHCTLQLENTSICPKMVIFWSKWTNLHHIAQFSKVKKNMLSKYTDLSIVQFHIVVLWGKYTMSVITDGWQVVVSPYPRGCPYWDDPNIHTSSLSQLVKFPGPVNWPSLIQQRYSCVVTVQWSGACWLQTGLLSTAY